MRSVTRYAVESPSASSSSPASVVRRHATSSAIGGIDFFVNSLTPAADRAWLRSGWPSRRSSVCCAVSRECCRGRSAEEGLRIPGQWLRDRPRRRSLLAL